MEFVGHEQESEHDEGEADSPRGSAAWLDSWWLQGMFVFLVAISLRLVFLAQAAETEFPAQLGFLNDAGYYATWSERIAGGEWIGKHSFFMGPLYPYTLAVISWFSEGTPIQATSGGGAVYDYAHVFRLQAVCGSLSCVLMFALTRLLFGAWQGVLAGLLTAGYRVFIYFEGLLMPATQGLFVSLLALVLLVLAARRERLWLWAAAGAAIGLAALSRGPGLLLLPSVFLWLAVGFPDLRKRARLGRALLVASGCLPLVFAATAHNYAADGDTVLITSNAGPNLWIGNGPSASGAHAGVSSRFVSSKLDFYAFDMDRPADEPPASEVSSILAKEALAFMLENPGRTAALFWKKFRMYWNEVEVGTTDHFYFFAERAPLLQIPTPGFGLLVPLGIVGMLLMLGRWREFLPLHLLVATQCASFTVFFMLGRYRFAGVACLIVFAVAALDWGLRAARERRFGSLGLAALGLVLAAFLVHTSIEGMGRERGVANQHYLLAGIAGNDSDLAMKYYEAALPENWREGDLSLRQQVMTRIRLGDRDARAGRFQQAIEHFERAKELCGEMSEDFRYRQSLADELSGRLRLLKGSRGLRSGSSGD